MAEAVSEATAAHLREFVATELGLHFPPERQQDLLRGLASAAGEFGFRDLESGVEWLLSAPLTPAQTEILASHLTVGETYFFRDGNLFDALEIQVFPELFAARRATGQRLRLWSAGCCTGEEPYSIAILLHRLLPDLAAWNVTLLATDINVRFLRKAKAGVYTEWSFRDCPAPLKTRYFRQLPGKQFEILPEVKRLVTFAYLNLAKDVFPSLLNNTNAMDLILCRNVLMYFAPAKAAHVAEALQDALVADGWLAVSPSEASHSLFSRLRTMNYPGTILYRKGRVDTTAKPSPAPLECSTFGLTEAVPEPEPETWFPAFKAVEAPAGAPRQAATVTLEAAEEFYHHGRYEEARQAALAYHADHPGAAAAMELLARVHANQGDLAGALAWCGRALAADRLDPSCHYLQAMILQETGELEEAAASLRLALYLDPDHILAHFALGDLARRQRRGQEAQRQWRNALTLLAKVPGETPLAEADGLTAGRLTEILRSAMEQEALHG
ncbi:MAG: tetratricopeptide repeat protein [Candidatus Hydrogenedentes bacterium]|nr:tetratricopeptide repeat protein [Candidatus Hydrogenedentota bacterium]